MSGPDPDDDRGDYDDRDYPDRESYYEPFCGPYWTDPLHDERQERITADLCDGRNPLTGLFDP